MRSSWKLGVCLIMAFAVLLAGQLALAGSQEITAKLNSGDFILNADNFMVIFDKSGSMGDWYAGQRKVCYEKKLVGLFNATVPDAKLSAGLREFGENNWNFDVTQLDYGVTTYNRDALGKVVAKLERPFGNSPLDVALLAAGKDLAGSAGKSAIVVFSDGVDMKEAPMVKAATEVKKQYGDRLCIYTVQIGNDANGAKVLDKVAKASECGFAVNGDKVADDASMTAFVEKIFLAAAPPKPVAPPPVAEKKVEPQAAPKKELKEKVTISLNVQFDTDKAVVKPKYKDDIKKVADFMKEYPDTKATIEGNTDNTGSAAYNKKLSKKRADAVAAYLVKNFGIDKSRLSTVGYGFDKPVASNKTAKGRQQNRRVDAVIETIVTKYE